MQQIVAIYSQCCNANGIDDDSNPFSLIECVTAQTDETTVTANNRKVFQDL